MASELETCLAESGTVAFRVAFKVLRSREDAEDVSQEAVVRALERFETLNDRNRFRAWLVRVAWRLAIDRRRADWRRAGRETHLVSSGVSDADTERDLIARERAQHLQAAVDRLPAKLRTPLVLGHIEERSLDEVAAMLQLPAGTVKSRSFHARRRLKQSLVKAGVALAVAIAGSMVVQRLQFVDTHDVPAIADPFSSVATARPLPANVQAAKPGAVRAKPAVTVSESEPVKQAPKEMTVLSAPTVEAPVVAVPSVRVPVLQVPVVADPSTIAAGPGLTERQR